MPKKKEEETKVLDDNALATQELIKRKNEELKKWKGGNK